MEYAVETMKDSLSSWVKLVCGEREITFSWDVDRDGRSRLCAHPDFDWMMLGSAYTANALAELLYEYGRTGMSLVRLKQASQEVWKAAEQTKTVSYTH